MPEAFKCPNCSNFTRLKTLLFVKDCTNQEYAKWVFDYRLSGFFKKINFELWTKKMHKLGMSYEFWEKYKELKGENINEDKDELIPYETLQKFISILVIKLNNGLTKEQIINELYDVEISNNQIDYCFNEAELKIKLGV